MTRFSCLHPARNTNSPQAFLLRNPHLHVPKHHYHETKLPKKDNLVFRPLQVPARYCLPFLSFRNSRLTHPFANLSSFADAEGEKEQEGEAKASEEDLPGMAQALNISSTTASAIAIFIAFAALSLPFFMKSLGQGVGLKTKFLSYATLLFGFYMAWNIGANDVANAMGTSVGSGALTLRQAVLTAAILEFSGALLMGTHVTNTMQKGILVANVFQGNSTLLFAGLLSSLASAGCIVLWVAGFDHALYSRIYGWIRPGLWGTWRCFLDVSCKGYFIVGYLTCNRSLGVFPSLQMHPQIFYSARNPGLAAAAAAPIAVFLGVTGISFAGFPLSKSFPIALGQALGCGAVGAFIVYNIIRNQLGHLLAKATSSSHSEPEESTTQTKNLGLLSDVAGPKGTQLEIVYGVSGTCRYCQLASCHSPMEETMFQTRWGL
ncbi:Inorganic phosphate transporter 2-1 [Hibiscus syriacus]|uniref:Phosphate transporter n=1 Tax=Hibiscus syriacus TaxID=106335 RepID=A0A6A3BUF2_HIBSY|nr:Inorganic phosphate transporter 2-1 [Hibiscus syriacus]